MSKMTTAVVGACALALAATEHASADLFQIDIVGTVDFGTLNQGAFQGMQSGDPTTMSFQVDSANFVDGAPDPIDGTINRRGYEIIGSSFGLTVNGTTVGMLSPYPDGTAPNFVIRDDDPGVDGFYLSSVPGLGLDNGVTIDYDAVLAPQFQALFSATYEGSRLPSLDIADAAGTYDFTGLTVFNWGMEDGPVQPVGFIFDSFSITQVPTPGALTVLAPIAASVRRRRR